MSFKFSDNAGIEVASMRNTEMAPKIAPSANYLFSVVLTPLKKHIKTAAVYRKTNNK